MVSREHLSQEVLGKRLTPFDRAIDMHISNLRRKLPGVKTVIHGSKPCVVAVI